MLVLLALARMYLVGKKNMLWMLPKRQHRSKSWWENFEGASCQCTSFCSLLMKDLRLPYEGNSCHLKYPTTVNSAYKVLLPREKLAALEQLSSTSTRPAKMAVMFNILMSTHRQRWVLFREIILTRTDHLSLDTTLSISTLLTHFCCSCLLHGPTSHSTGQNREAIEILTRNPHS